MTNVMKTPTSHRRFQDFLIDQVDITRFFFTLDEMLAAAQLASFASSDSDGLKQTRHKVLRQIDTRSVSLSTDLIKNLKNSNPPSTLALLTTTLALPTPTPSVTMRSVIPDFLSFESSSTALEGQLSIWERTGPGGLFGSTFPATRRV